MLSFKKPTNALLLNYTLITVIKTLGLSINVYKYQSEFPPRLKRNANKNRKMTNCKYRNDLIIAFGAFISGSSVSEHN